MFVSASFIAKAQQMQCLTPEQEETLIKSRDQSNSSLINCLSALERADETLPLVTIKANIHYIAYNDDNGNLVNFVPGPENDTHWENGNYYGRRFIEFANNNRFKVFEPNPIGLADFLGDSRIRIELYSDPDNAADQHGGIWYWDAEPEQFPYEGEVMNIIVKTNGSSTISGAITGTNGVIIYDWHRESSILQDNNYKYKVRVFLHELGHLAGLCHSFSCNNGCPDINEVAECGNPSVGCASSCGDDNGDGCTPPEERNNIMSSFSVAKSISPCQWATIYEFLYLDRKPFVTVAGCSGESSGTQTIASGEHIVWDTPKALTGNLVIEPNASLHITCLVFAGEDVVIQVKRGGKLTIENGEIRRLCEDKNWAGIWVEGHRGKEQPAVNISNPQVNYADPNVAGILVLLNATLNGGGTVIQDGRQSDANNWDYFGGVIIAEHSTFLNNQRGAAFMSYPFLTKSYLLNCDFIEEEGADIQNSMGITVWNTIGLQINHCGFFNLDKYGIHGWDFGASIKQGNQFVNTLRGIDIYSTYPLSSANGATVIGPDQFNEPHNLFENDFIPNPIMAGGIVVESTDLIFDLKIQHNDFYNSRNPILVSGEAFYTISRNTLFKSVPGGIRLLSTGTDSDNLVSCNTFGDMQLFSIYPGGDNSGLEILDNDFYYQGNPNFKSILLQPSSIINSLQGRLNNPADNCFPSPTEAFAVMAGAAPFTYFADEVSAPPNCTLVPESFGQFLVETVGPSGTDDCDLNAPMFFGDTTLTNLIAKRAEWAAAKNIALANPGDLLLQGTARETYEAKEAVYRSLLGKLIAEGAYEQAEEAILQDGGQRALRWQIGLRLLQGDAAGAQQLLNQFPQIDEAEAMFAYIMQVNINRLQNEGVYELSAQEEIRLHEIAYSSTPYRSYARGILSLLKGEEFMDPVPVATEAMQAANPGNPEDVLPRYQVFPNPAQDRVTILYPASSEPFMLEMLNLQSGRVDMQLTLPAEGRFELDIQTLLPGVYSLVFTSAAQEIHLEKLVIIK